MMQWWRKRKRTQQEEKNEVWINKKWWVRLKWRRCKEQRWVQEGGGRRNNYEVRKVGGRFYVGMTTDEVEVAWAPQWRREGRDDDTCVNDGEAGRHRWQQSTLWWHIRDEKNDMVGKGEARQTLARSGQTIVRFGRHRCAGSVKVLQGTTRIALRFGCFRDGEVTVQPRLTTMPRAMFSLVATHGHCC
jgi:hypothetical protein